MYKRASWVVRRARGSGSNLKWEVNVEASFYFPREVLQMRWELCSLFRNGFCRYSGFVVHWRLNLVGWPGCSLMAEVKAQFGGLLAGDWFWMTNAWKEACSSFPREVPIDYHVNDNIDIADVSAMLVGVKGLRYLFSIATTSNIMASSKRKYVDCL